MVWKELNKESIELLKDTDMYVLVFDPNNSEYTYDIIKFISLDEEFYPDVEDRQVWYSMMHACPFPFGNNHTYEYESDEMVYDLFTHYQILKKPKIKKSTSIDAKQ